MNCIICEGIIDTGPSDQDQFCTALEATEFSKLVSMRGEINFDPFIISSCCRSQGSSKKDCSSLDPF